MVHELLLLLLISTVLLETILLGSCLVSSQGPCRPYYARSSTFISCALLVRAGRIEVVGCSKGRLGKVLVTILLTHCTSQNGVRWIAMIVMKAFSISNLYDFEVY
jgi:hypothetical protein